MQYVDDNSTEWVATKHIPRLKIRQHVVVTRPFYKRIWDQRQMLLHLQKRVLNVKRGLKVLLDVAMTGSKMQWYQMELTEEQSGAKFVRGTVNVRFLYHTRGSVLRGLDIAVSHMSLGERAKVEIRSDYGFGEVYSMRQIPPYTSLVFIAQVVAIENHSAKSLLLRRAVRDAFEDSVFRVKSVMLAKASCLVQSGLVQAWRRIKFVRRRQATPEPVEDGLVSVEEASEGGHIQTL